MRRLAPSALMVLSCMACIGAPADAELSAAERQALSRFVTESKPANLIGHEASFGGTRSTPLVTLVGYLLKPRTLAQAAGSTFEVTFVWQVHAPPPDDFQVFTHLLDARGHMLVNLDSQGVLRARPGRAGVPFPPSQWPDGRFVLDPVRVSLPKDAPYDLRLQVGFYRGGERLAAHGDGVDARQAAAVLKLNAKGSASGPSVPELVVPHLADGTRITIDGMLDEAAWKRAARTGAFVSPSTGAVAPRAPVQGSARLMYDQRSLYIAFEVADRDVRGGFPDGARDPHLWTRDTVEIMLDPDGDGDNRDYYEIQIGPQNLIFDSRFDDYNQPRGGPDGPFGHQHWSAAAETAVTLDGTLDDPSDVDGGYVVEARIPFASFDKAKRSPPSPGDRWRANLYAMQNNGGVAWSPILGEGNFHRASRFGRLIWSEETIP